MLSCDLQLILFIIFLKKFFCDNIVPKKIIFCGKKVKSCMGKILNKIHYFDHKRLTKLFILIIRAWIKLFYFDNKNLNILHYFAWLYFDFL